MAGGAINERGKLGTVLVLLLAGGVFQILTYFLLGGLIRSSLNIQFLTWVVSGVPFLFSVALLFVSLSWTGRLNPIEIFGRMGEQKGMLRAVGIGLIPMALWWLAWSLTVPNNLGMSTYTLRGQLAAGNLILWIQFLLLGPANALGVLILSSAEDDAERARYLGAYLMLQAIVSIVIPMASTGIQYSGWIYSLLTALIGFLMILGLVKIGGQSRLPVGVYLFSSWAMGLIAAPSDPMIRTATFLISTLIIWGIALFGRSEPG